MRVYENYYFWFRYKLIIISCNGKACEYSFMISIDIFISFTPCFFHPPFNYFQFIIFVFFTHTHTHTLDFYHPVKNLKISFTIRFGNGPFKYNNNYYVVVSIQILYHI